MSRELEAAVESAQDYALGSRAETTRHGYATDFRLFKAWCEPNRLESLPAKPATVAVYLAHLADTGRKVSTIDRALCGIRYEHRVKGFPGVLKDSDVIAKVLDGIHRKLGVSVTKKRPFLDVELVTSQLPDTLIGVRDRAILTLGFICAFRRSELVALDVSDLHEAPEGLRVHLRRSKTDQEGKGFWKAVPRSTGGVCPVAAMHAWLARAELEEGPLFRRIRRGQHVMNERLGMHSIAIVVKQAIARTGVDASGYSSHSLRAGFVTKAAKAGAPIDAIMRQTGHVSPQSVVGYIRFENLFDQSAAKDLL